MILFNVFDQIRFGIGLRLTLIPLTLKIHGNVQRKYILSRDMTVQEMVIEVEYRGE